MLPVAQLPQEVFLHEARHAIDPASLDVGARVVGAGVVGACVGWRVGRAVGAGDEEGARVGDAVICLADLLTEASVISSVVTPTTVATVCVKACIILGFKKSE